MESSKSCLHANIQDKKKFFLGVLSWCKLAGHFGGGGLISSKISAFGLQRAQNEWFRVMEQPKICNLQVESEFLDNSVRSYALRTVDKTNPSYTGVRLNT